MKIKQHKTDGRKTANDTLTTLLRVSVIATFGLVLCAGVRGHGAAASRARFITSTLAQRQRYQ
ncbi:MAG: hypothetical protein CHKLHMKO_00439 [Candidatus Argoarchaeum ethanivorans]|uniref:Uncharacterized protein n=1 Tax=Candidatus Argoarchaeum ethanivorans TaxID=2608793 RepID=A0A811TC77_9EURY|nr:MAG: hypothetical protein CHKLHMKO_00439 [Candidatus Argoarchaeum ethanivorans]